MVGDTSVVTMGMSFGVVSLAGEERVAVDGLAMSIEIASQRMWLCCFFCWNMRGMPELGSPAREGRGEVVGPIGGSYLRQKDFGVAVAIGTHPSGKQRQAIGGIAAQILRAL